MPTPTTLNDPQGCAVTPEPDKKPGSPLDKVTDDRALSGLLKRMRDGYFRTSLAGDILIANPACLDILHYDSADELVGQINVSELYVDPSRVSGDRIMPGHPSALRSGLLMRCQMLLCANSLST